MSCSDIFLGIIAVIFPPIAVWIKRGLCSADSLINICLCMLAYFPGLLHAWYIIAKYPEHDLDYEALDPESGRRRQRVTYYYISHENGRAGQPQQPQSYGTSASSPAPKVPGNKPAKKGQQNGIASGGPSSATAGPSVGAGSEEPGAPPSYSEVVQSDNKIQRQQ